MISAFDVYLVMQLDSIRQFLGVIAVIFTMGGGFAVAMLLDVEEGLPWKVLAFPLSGLLLGALSAFLPSSQTAAAMMVLPAITSAEVTEVVAPEAREVWGLAKEALREMAHQSDEGKAEKEGHPECPTN